MKKIRYFLPIFCLAICFACMDSSDSDPQPQIPDDPVGKGSDMPLIYMGDFMDAAHPTSGKASADPKTSVLKFTDFKTDNGPLLEVYLATDTKASEFVSLGKLKGLQGDFSYDMPEEIDLEKYQYVLIWCVEFSVNFGHAKIEK